MQARDSRLRTPEASIDRGRTHLQVFEQGFKSTCKVLCVFFVGNARLTDMEGENYLRTLLANSPPNLVITHNSQNSVSVSFVPLSSILVASVFVNSVLTSPPPPLPQRAPVVVQERH